MSATKNTWIRLSKTIILVFYIYIYIFTLLVQFLPCYLLWEIGTVKAEFSKGSEHATCILQKTVDQSRRWGAASFINTKSNISINMHLHRRKERYILVPSRRAFFFLCAYALKWLERLTPLWNVVLQCTHTFLLSSLFSVTETQHIEWNTNSHYRYYNTCPFIHLY